ncbi:type II toxin-antitoxin system RelE/ParE family toxin [Methylotuvimicrobium alcaliphilum]|uniref:type II toxin-antitoxin system RelE/ParE family toxin n=1 Tax=Methylotuvimicrobium alcaliphilum TaxID=271065 RepID=UPI001CC2336B|nr:type II toxin-antitoxin system RelE/ParE family toxin [Methylotuvimicrobium alcaliphilum]
MPSLAIVKDYRFFPHRGNRRDKIRPGLRIPNYKRRTTIAFEVGEDFVSIIGIFHGGRDFETILQLDNAVKKGKCQL